MRILPPDAEPTSACPGSAQDPEAASGFVCIYMAILAGTSSAIVLDPTSSDPDGLNYNFNTEAASTVGDGTVSTLGFKIALSGSGSISQPSGSWAVTG